MLNIYSNAIKFTDRKGSIKIVVEKVLKGSQTLSGLEINISDEDLL